MSNSFLENLKKRRSIYALGKNVKLSEDEITEIIEEAIRQSPSAFNSQSIRAVILYGKAHDELWDGILDILHGEVPNEEALKLPRQRSKAHLRLDSEPSSSTPMKTSSLT
ncbi:hypothetical protein PLO_1097 [Pediococcus acidilactici NGRI 0510Q]|nr:hypothetical protein PLO_1097 [Pediococcus acidilactici NGRI 0510Q]